MQAVHSTTNVPEENMEITGYDDGTIMLKPYTKQEEQNDVQTKLKVMA